MAQAATLSKFRNKRAKPQEIRMHEFPDWDSYLYSLWRENMTFNPGLYDDAKLQHGWSCKCCSRTIFYVEEKKKK